MPILQRLFAFTLLCGSSVWLLGADSFGDISRIQAVVSEINAARAHSDYKALARLFTSDGDFQVAGQPAAKGPKEIESLPGDRAWSELTAPIIGGVSGRDVSVHLLTANTASIDAVQTQFGPVLINRTPVVLLLRREANQWRVTSLRVLALNYSVR